MANLATRILGSVLCTCASAVAQPELAAPRFHLPRYQSQEQVSLTNYCGQIVVLDFFAHWCVPCVRVAQELERGVQRYYAERQGIPVQVLSINIDLSRPQKTAEFLSRTSASLVLEDNGGEVFRQYGGDGLPYLVIIDARQLRPASGMARIVYRYAGYEGLAKVRAVIDGIGQHKGPNASGSLVATSVTRWAGIETALLLSPGITIADTAVDYRQSGPASEWGLNAAWGRLTLQYEPTKPIDLFGQTNHLSNDRGSFQTRYRWRANERFTLLGSGGGYTGYQDYRSFWLNEYFRQRFGTVSGYREANPQGYNAALGGRWEYLPANGLLQTDVSWQQDWISPGYEKVPFRPLTRFRSLLDTVSGRLTLENVLARRLRSLLEYQATSTTDRQLRHALQGSLNYAPAEHWVARLAAGGTTEAPRFNSWSVGSSLEHDWNDTWFLGLLGRYYQDNGLIENALAISTAAPALQTILLGIGLRWQGRADSARIVAGPYWSNYAATAPGTLEFSRLYRVGPGCRSNLLSPTNFSWYNVSVMKTYHLLLGLLAVAILLVANWYLPRPHPSAGSPAISC